MNGMYTIYLPYTWSFNLIDIHRNAVYNIGLWLHEKNIDDCNLMQRNFGVISCASPNPLPRQQLISLQIVYVSHNIKLKYEVTHIVI